MEFRNGQKVYKRNKDGIYLEGIFKRKHKDGIHATVVFSGCIRQKVKLNSLKTELPEKVRREYELFNKALEEADNQLWRIKDQLDSNRL